MQPFKITALLITWCQNFNWPKRLGTASLIPHHWLLTTSSDAFLLPLESLAIPQLITISVSI